MFSLKDLTGENISDIISKIHRKGIYMTKSNFMKERILFLLELLKESEESCPFSTTEISEKLRKKGIVCDKRTIKDDIEMLQRNGYEIFCDKKGSMNYYYMCSGDFDEAELRILMDSVQAASFVTEKKTRKLTEKIASQAGERKAELLKRNITEFNVVKHSNEEIYYNVDKIQRAIIQKNKIEFLYFNLLPGGKKEYRQDGRKYTVSPLSTVISGDNYYLICIDDSHSKPTNYRIDRMQRLEILPEKVREYPENEEFKITEHRKQAFYMFTGESAEVIIEITKKLINVVADKFGENVQYEKVGEDKYRFKAMVQLSRMFYGWCLSFGSDMRLIAPAFVVNKLSEYLAELTTVYHFTRS